MYHCLKQVTEVKFLKQKASDIVVTPPPVIQVDVLTKASFDLFFCFGVLLRSKVHFRQILYACPCRVLIDFDGITMLITN